MLRSSALYNMHRLATASSRNATRRGQGTRFSTSSTNGSNPSSTTGAAKSVAEAEAARQQVLHEANETMKTYHHARLAKLRGELPSKRKDGPQINYLQVGIVVSFVIAFAASPFLGRKIAHDKEFREKYIPAWYDFTIKKPTSELSREEVHEQILQLQKEIRARAIRGEFTDEKVAKMRRYMEGLDPENNEEFNPDKDQHAWSKLHPGVDDDEQVEDEEE
jgi:hypothetical protein